MTQQIQTFTAGQWRDASGPQYLTEYPADGSPVAALHAATAGDVDEAVQVADVARQHTSWANLKPHERASLLHRIAAGIRERGEELAQLQRLDNGKPIRETRALVASAAGTFQFFAAACETLEDQITPSRGDFITMSLHQPLGVVGAITPWNSPIASEAQKLAPALAAGCAVVFKPAEITPRMAIELARIAQQAGVPDGIISVLPGKGSVVGDALVRHPLIKRIAFTGGTAVGMGIARIGAEKLMPTSLELGGKSPTIVCADADLDHAVAGVLYGIFSSSGESCIAGSRAFVHASSLSDFGLGSRRGESRCQARRRRRRVASPHKEPATTHGAANRHGPSGWACKGAHALLQILAGCATRLRFAPSLHPLAGPTRAQPKARQAASVYNEFKSRLLAGVKALRVGDPASEDTQMGPLVSMGHRASIERYVQIGLDEGGKLLAGGARPSGALFDKGSYYLPTVIEGLPNNARMCQEEIFGPVLAMLPWSDEADLIAQCNDNVYGLAAGIWTRDYKTVWRIGAALQTGTVWVNTYKMFSSSTPFGGVKMSGTGREKGRLGILEYMNQKSYYWGLNVAPLAWSST